MNDSRRTYTPGRRAPVSFSPAHRRRADLRLLPMLLASIVLVLAGCNSPSANPRSSPRAAMITTVAGTGSVCTRELLPCGDGGPARNAPLGTPDAATALPNGGYLIAERDIQKIRMVSPQGIISTVVGNGLACPEPTASCGDGGPATRAQINHPHFVIATPDGGFMIADRLDNRIRKVSADGVITTLAGNGLPCRPQPDTCGDGGAATEARISYPQVISLLPGGGVLLAGLENRVREVSPDGVINTVAGTGVPCPAPADPCGDGGKASAGRFNDAHGVVALPDGGFLVADRLDNRIRKVSTSGVIETVVGTGAACDATASPCGSGGQARAAQLNSPIGMTLTSAGGYLVLDGGANLVRYVSDAGTISTVAGSGAFCEPSGRAPRTQEKAGSNVPDKATGSCGDGGLAREAALSSPHSASFVPAGVIIDDRDDDRVRLLTGTGLHAV
jgi:hypothetical protein